MQQNLRAFLRRVDDFLQLLTLGISPSSRQNTAVTTAEYRELPAAIVPVEGTGKRKQSFLLKLSTFSLKETTNEGKVGTDPLRICLPALALEACKRHTADQAPMFEYILFNRSCSSAPRRGPIIQRIAGPTCMRSAIETGGGQGPLEFYWPSKLSAIMDNILRGPWQVPMSDVHGQICICKLVHVQVIAQLLI